MTVPLKPGWYEAEPEKPIRRNLNSPEKVKQTRSRGGLRGSKSRVVNDRLAKVFAELDEENEP